MPRLTFEYKITFGNIVQIGVIAFSLIAGWFTLVGTSSANAEAIASLQQAVAPFDSFNTRLTVVESRAESADKRQSEIITAIDRLLDQMTQDRISNADVRKDVGYLRDWVEEQKRAVKK